MKCEGCPFENINLLRDEHGVIYGCLLNINKSSCTFSESDKVLLNAMLAGEWSCSTCEFWQKDKCRLFHDPLPCKRWQPREKGGSDE